MILVGGCTVGLVSGRLCIVFLGLEGPGGHLHAALKGLVDD